MYPNRNNQANYINQNPNASLPPRHVRLPSSPRQVHAAYHQANCMNQNLSSSSRRVVPFAPYNGQVSEAHACQGSPAYQLHDIYQHLSGTVPLSNQVIFHDVPHHPTHSNSLSNSLPHFPNPEPHSSFTSPNTNPPTFSNPFSAHTSPHVTNHLAKFPDVPPGLSPISKLPIPNHQANAPEVPTDLGPYRKPSVPSHDHYHTHVPEFPLGLGHFPAQSPVLDSLHGQQQIGPPPNYHHQPNAGYNQSPLWNQGVVNDERRMSLESNVSLDAGYNPYATIPVQRPLTNDQRGSSWQGNVELNTGYNWPTPMTSCGPVVNDQRRMSREEEVEVKNVVNQVLREQRHPAFKGAKNRFRRRKFQVEKHNPGADAVSFRLQNRRNDVLRTNGFVPTPNQGLTVVPHPSDAPSPETEGLAHVLGHLHLSELQQENRIQVWPVVHDNGSLETNQRLLDQHQPEGEEHLPCLDIDRNQTPTQARFRRMVDDLVRTPTPRQTQSWRLEETEGPGNPDTFVVGYPNNLLVEQETIATEFLADIESLLRRLGIDLHLALRGQAGGSDRERQEWLRLCGLAKSLYCMYQTRVSEQASNDDTAENSLHRLLLSDNNGAGALVTRLSQVLKQLRRWPGLVRQDGDEEDRFDSGDGTIMVDSTNANSTNLRACTPTDGTDQPVHGDNSDAETVDLALVPRKPKMAQEAFQQFQRTVIEPKLQAFWEGREISKHPRNGQRPNNPRWRQDHEDQSQRVPSMMPVSTPVVRPSRRYSAAIPIVAPPNHNTLASSSHTNGYQAIQTRSRSNTLESTTSFTSTSTHSSTFSVDPHRANEDIGAPGKTSRFAGALRGRKQGNVDLADPNVTGTRHPPNCLCSLCRWNNTVVEGVAPEAIHGSSRLWNVNGLV